VTGVLEHVHVVTRPHGLPVRLEVATFVTGAGLLLDHRNKPGVRRAVTAIRAETVEDVARSLGRDLPPGASRRNLTIRGLELDALEPGTVLELGAVRLEVRGPCDPCVKMEHALGAGALRLLSGRGGLVLGVRAGGVVAVGTQARVV